MKTIDATDAARVELMLGELRLPGIKMVWTELAVRADKEGWPAARFLAALTEYEIAERSRRRTARHMSEARLPVGKTTSKKQDVPRQTLQAFFDLCKSAPHDLPYSLFGDSACSLNAPTSQAMRQLLICSL